jgi:hypothetical protein
VKGWRFEKVIEVDSVDVGPLGIPTPKHSTLYLMMSPFLSASFGMFHDSRRVVVSTVRTTLSGGPDGLSLEVVTTTSREIRTTKHMY